MRGSLVVVCAFTAQASLSSAQTWTANGGVASGFIGGGPASAIEAGVDLATDEVQVGVGGRLVMKSDGDLRREDWDQPSEWATLLRYFSYRRPAFEEDVQVSVAAGELSGVTVGAGALVDDYSSGIDLDHRHLGVHGSVFATDAGATVVVDDVVAPRIAAARGYYRVIDHLYAAVELSTDVSAPSADGEDTLLGFASGLSYLARRHGRPWWLEGYATMAGWKGLGSGAHVGGRAHVSERAWTLEADGQIILASAGYVPAYIGSLYERQRYVVEPGSTQLDVARAGQLGGIGGRGVLRASRAGVGSAELRFGHRPGFGLHVAGRVLSLERKRLQVGVGGAHQRLGDSGRAMVAATEIRLRLPAHLYASGQLSRMYRRTDMAVEPAWVAWLALGGVVGE